MTAELRAQLARERRANARLRRLGAAAAAFSAAATPMQVAEVAVEQFGRLFDTTSVAMFEHRGPDGLDAMALGGWVEGAREAWTTMPIDAPAPVADAARTRAPAWTESTAAWRERYPHLVAMLDGTATPGCSASRCWSTTRRSGRWGSASPPTAPSTTTSGRTRSR